MSNFILVIFDCSMSRKYTAFPHTWVGTVESWPTEQLCVTSPASWDLAGLGGEWLAGAPVPCPVVAGGCPLTPEEH